MPSAIPASTVRIARAHMFDAKLLASLHHACFASAHQRPWSEDEMAQFIAGPGTLCLIGIAIDTGETPVGFLIARASAEEAELLSMGVLPAAQHCGMGRALLRHGADALRESGVGCLFLEVDENNTPARALYESLGARAVGRRLGYYEDGADAALYRLDL